MRSNRESMKRPRLDEGGESDRRHVQPDISGLYDGEPVAPTPSRGGSQGGGAELWDDSWAILPPSSQGELSRKGGLLAVRCLSFGKRWVEKAVS